MMQGKSKYAERLKQAKASFMQAGKQATVTGGIEAIPVGQYTGVLRAKIKESQTGSLMVARTFFITEGEYAGVPVYDNLIIDHPNLEVSGRGQRDLCLMFQKLGIGFDPANPDTLEDCLEKLTEAKPVVVFKTRHSGGDAGERPFVNCSIIDCPAVDTRAAVKTKNDPAPVDDDLDTQIMEFGNKHSINLKDCDTTEDAVKTIISFGVYVKSDLTEDEFTFLDKIGAKIIDGKKKESPAKKAVAAPAKKAKR